MLLALTENEIDQICKGLKQNSAKNRFLKGLGLTVRKRRNRTPLVNRYSLFNCHSGVTQDLKTVIAEHLDARKKRLATDQHESSDTICHKNGRIINGEPEHTDRWVDIAGSAKHVVDRLQGGGTMTITSANYVTIAVAAKLTGLSEKAIRRKIEEGKWLEGLQFIRSSDGGIFISLKGYDLWVEQGSSRGKTPSGSSSLSMASRSARH